MKPIALLLLMILPTAVFAETSTEVPSIAHMLLQSFLLSVMLFFLSRFRWWLIFFGLAVALLFGGGTVEIWRDDAMREALLDEQGSIYFASAAFANLCLVAAAVLGVLSGRRRHDDQPGATVDRSQAGGN